jgi:hypothetical protein
MFKLSRGFDIALIGALAGVVSLYAGSHMDRIAELTMSNHARAASPITLQDADAKACDTYELAKGAHRDAISDLLTDAAQRVQTSGCVNIVIVEA